MKVERQVLHYCLDKAKEFIKLGERDKARDYCDMGIAYVAGKKENGIPNTVTYSGSNRL